MKTTTLIPIQMCFDVLKEKNSRALQVYIYLKFHCSGKIRLDKDFLQQAADDLGLKSTKTVTSQIGILKKKRWICLSNRSGYCFIKGYDSIRKNEGYVSRVSAEFDLKDIIPFKGFLVAAVISFLIKKQKVRAMAVERKRRRSKTSTIVRTDYFPIANEALAKIMGISVSTAYQWKQLAEKQGYISIRKNLQVVKNVQPEYLPQLKKYSDIEAKGLFCRKGAIYEQLPDEVSAKIYLRKRRKLTDYDGKK